MFSFYRSMGVVAALVFGMLAPAHATILDATTKSVELVTTSTAPIHYEANYADHTTTTFVAGNSSAIISTATTTTIIAAPAASTQRQVKSIEVRNASTTENNTVTLQIDVSGTNVELYKRTLAPGESFDVSSDDNITLYDTNGRPIATEVQAANISGTVYPFSKIGLSKDSAGYMVSTLSASGFPGASALQAPGLNGFATDCSIGTQTTNPNGAAQIGANVLPNPSSGALYLRRVDMQSTQAEAVQLIDVIWYNTGTVVTTTTAQTITMPTLPSRDLNGTNNGAGWQVALYATGALGNAATVSNTTISYTDQNGNAGNTGVFNAPVGWLAPATPVVGTWVPFTLAAGDTGVRSVQSLTLNTSYVSGTISLVLYRPLAIVPIGSTTAPASVDFGNPGVRIFSGSCLAAIQFGSATSSNLNGTYAIVEK